MALQNYIFFGDKDLPIIYIYDKSSLRNISSYRLRDNGGITDMVMFGPGMQPRPRGRSEYTPCIRYTVALDI